MDTSAHRQAESGIEPSVLGPRLTAQPAELQPPQDTIQSGCCCLPNKPDNKKCVPCQKRRVSGPLVKEYIHQYKNKKPSLRLWTKNEIVLFFQYCESKYMIDFGVWNVFYLGPTDSRVVLVMEEVDLN